MDKHSDWMVQIGPALYTADFVRAVRDACNDYLCSCPAHKYGFCCWASQQKDPFGAQLGEQVYGLVGAVMTDMGYSKFDGFVAEQTGYNAERARFVRRLRGWLGVKLTSTEALQEMHRKCEEYLQKRPHHPCGFCFWAGRGGEANHVYRLVGDVMEALGIPGMHVSETSGHNEERATFVSRMHKHLSDELRMRGTPEA
jgi:hypothetical protein